MTRPFLVLFISLLMSMLAVPSGEARQVSASSPHVPVAGKRLAEGSGRACVASCIAQCRAQEQSCGRTPNCAAQYQICARRCVVSCGSR